MKKLLYLFGLLITTQMWSQGRDPQMAQFDFVPGEIIVKLSDDIDTQTTYGADGRATSDFDIAGYLELEGMVTTSKVMFHQRSIEASIINSERISRENAARSASNPNNGYVPSTPLTMKNIFVLSIDQTQGQTQGQGDVLSIINRIKNRPGVVYAEPNYNFHIDDFKLGEVITKEEAEAMAENSRSNTRSSSSPLLNPLTPDDPLFGQQSNITATNIDDVWGDYTTGDGSQVIAVLDTGVDYTHPDLEANIWINQAELNGVPDFDDDGNGFIDDIRGWDFINIDNAPLDDNMHGTHVAGIAGAVGNNSIGIAGAAWNVKLMPIKVFQSTGVGNLTTIAEGVEYASNNGATILNMSFGSYAESATLKLALENAYATAILVAAAGNNGRCIGPGIFCAPMYPGAYNYILGIEDHPKPPFGYTNYDQDGPVRTRYANLLNYEITAPGTGIMSTIPGGGYASLTGTSMSTPLVAGALALYAQEKPGDSKELMFGNLINTAGTPYVDFLGAMEAVPVPQLAVLSAATRDTINGQNGNEFIEPGEVIEILPLIKNYWGFTEDVRVGIEFAPFEDQTKATIVQSEIEIGSISSYATLQDLNQTLKVQIAPGVANNVDIRFMLTAWSGPNQEYISEPVELVLSVTNAIIFDQYITEDMTLTNDVEWIFANSMVVSNGATLTIEPGTIIKMSENRRIIVDPNSRIFSNGTPEEPVVIQSAGNGYWRGVSIEGDILDFENNSQTSLQDLKLHPLMSRAKFTYTNFIGWGLEGSEFGGAVQWYGNYFVGPGVYEDCNFQEFNYGWAYLCAGGIFDRCNLRYGTFVTKIIRSNAFDNFTTIWNDSNWSNLDLSGQHNLNDVIVGYTGLLTIDERYNFPNYNGPNYRGRIGHNLFNLRALTINWSQMTLEPEININLGSSTQGSGIFDFPSQVWVGTDNEDIIRQKFWDFTTSEVYVGTINYGTRPSGPSSGAHGIVWKVELNGVDAQDDYELLEPVGVGSHEFKVYFNRAMDTTVAPQISYGVREPYNQQIISEQGTWSADGKIYTVWHDVGVSGGDTNNIGASDGINRIRVQGARDLDFFDIPIENIRFNFLLQAAGSASTGFFGTSGLGQITLEWVAPDPTVIDDVLGYNMYRYQLNPDGTETELIQLNQTLIIDSDFSDPQVNFIDYAVEEGETYYYKYKILRTSFQETDFSQTVSVTALTAQLGDSNGDFNVNVLDVIQDVDYILGNNPTPFIFNAADVNDDQAINVLDIVGTVDIILNPLTGGPVTYGQYDYYPSESIGEAVFTWEDDALYVTSNHSISGLQLAFDTGFDYRLNSSFEGVEHLSYAQGGKTIIMLFSFDNKTLGQGKIKILDKTSVEGELLIERAVIATPEGERLTGIFGDQDLQDISAAFQGPELKILGVSPNPTSGQTTLQYYLPEQSAGVYALIYDMQGRLVDAKGGFSQDKGVSDHQISIDRLSPGTYILILKAQGKEGVQYIDTTKIIKN